MCWEGRRYRTAWRQQHLWPARILFQSTCRVSRWQQQSTNEADSLVHSRGTACPSAHKKQRKLFSSGAGASTPRTRWWRSRGSCA